MNTLILDLKGTLVDADGSLRSGTAALFQRVSSADARVVLYTMNEKWSYAVIRRNAELFQVFDELRIVKRKQLADLESFNAATTLVVGDSETEELAFGRTLGMLVLSAKDALPLDAISTFLGVRP